jgi:hypothetical protein
VLSGCCLLLLVLLQQEVLLEGPVLALALVDRLGQLAVC